MRAPVLLLCYNRPEHFKMALSQLGATECRQLYISRDGAASPMDSKLQAEMDATLEDFSSKGIEIKTNFLPRHVGLKNAVIAGIDWVFSHEVEAIILEDDIVAAPEFFSYCDDMLEKFRHDNRIWHVTGYNPSVWLSRLSSPRSQNMFLTSRVHVWGWATWASRWNAFRFADDAKEPLKNLDYLMKSKSLGSTLAITEYSRGKKLVDDGKVDTWDYHWATFVLKNFGRSISPQGRLTTNDGFGPAATHTKKGTTLPLRPLRQPGARSRDLVRLELYDFHIGVVNILKRWRKRLRRLLCESPRLLGSWRHQRTKI